MLAVVTTRAGHELVIIATVAERRLHLQIGQPPVPMLVVQVGLAILEKDP